MLRLEGGKSVIRYPNGIIGLIKFPMYRLEGGKSVIRYPNEIIGLIEFPMYRLAPTYACV